MNIEIISIGDELLVGQTINTNAAWMGREISMIGGSIHRCVCIKDDREEIVRAIDEAFSRVDVVLITGGLGPTKDDITKKVLADYFGTTLVQNDEVLSHVKSLFKSRGRKMQDVHYLQALVPESATVLSNMHGTAPGMLFKSQEKVLVSMPGVPYEMKYIMSTHVLPYLQSNYTMNALYYKTIYTVGIGESWLAKEIEDIEDDLRSRGYALAYLPSPGQVRLRISGAKSAENKAAIDLIAKNIYERLPQYCFSLMEEELAKVIGNILLDQGKTMGAVESCTGGELASSIVRFAGSSSYFLGSIVSYDNSVKHNLVGVDESALNEWGAVSQKVVEQMAEKGREKLGVDYCIAISGIAGPDGGSEDKPVGTVWIGIAGDHVLRSVKYQFELDRGRNIQRSVLTALNMLRCELLKINY